MSAAPMGWFVVRDVPREAELIELENFIADLMDGIFDPYVCCDHECDLDKPEPDSSRPHLVHMSLDQIAAVNAARLRERALETLRTLIEMARAGGGA